MIGICKYLLYHSTFSFTLSDEVEMLKIFSRSAQTQSLKKPRSRDEQKYEAITST